MFGRIRKARKDQLEAEWFINKKRGSVELEDNYILFKILMPSTEDIVFYKDITKFERIKKLIKIKTNTAEFKVSPTKVKGGEDEAKALYTQILEKINENK